MSAGLRGNSQFYDQPWYDTTGLIKLLITLDSTVVDSRNSADTQTLLAGLVVGQKSGEDTFVNTDSANLATGSPASVQSAAFAAWGGETLSVSASDGSVVSVDLTGATDAASTVALLVADEDFSARYLATETGTNQVTITAIDQLVSFTPSISNVSGAFPANEVLPSPVKYLIIYDNNVRMRGPTGPVENTEAQAVNGGGVAIVSKLQGLTSAARAYLISQGTVFQD